MNGTFIAAGGDARFSVLAGELAKKGTVYTLGADENMIKSDKIIKADSVSAIPEAADYLILPLPVSTDGETLNAPFYSGSIKLESLLPAVKKGGTVFGGKISPDVKRIFESEGLEVTDFLEREELAVANALCTAEGAVMLALEEQPVTLSGENVLILGMGRIAKSLIKVLSGFSCHITCAARKYSDLAWAEVCGCETAGINTGKLSLAVKKADIIFNTVPHVILTEPLLRLCSSDALIIDLASRPGGTDFEAAGRLGLRVVWALSLPGRTAPVTSGKIIAKAIENMIEEKSRQ